MHHDEDEAVSYSLELEGKLIKLPVISLSLNDEHNGAKIPAYTLNLGLRLMDAKCTQSF